MTKIEEAKKIAFQNFYKGAHGCFEVDVERVIAAVRAEGAEQGLDMAQRWIDSEFIQGRHVISLPKDALLASVLAPSPKAK